MRADLHIHTYYSDGALAPRDIPALAMRKGVEILAVTDHDTMLGIDETEKFCRTAEITFVSGCEISAYSGDVKVHVLCYCPDRENGGFRAFTNELYKNSFLRSEIIIAKLNAVGVNLTLRDAETERFCEEAPLHVMHIAAAGAKRGYARTAGEFFMKYLAYGKPAFCNAYRPSPERTVEIIAAAGGFSSLAHPARLDMNAEDVRALIGRLKSCGLCGIEAVYSTHTVRETAYYKELAKSFGLEVTGGSDTHYPVGKREIGIPAFYPSEKLSQRLKNC